MGENRRDSESCGFVGVETDTHGTGIGSFLARRQKVRKSLKFNTRLDLEIQMLLPCQCALYLPAKCT
jgi:hypothetical protein